VDSGGTAYSQRNESEEGAQRALDDCKNATGLTSANEVGKKRKKSRIVRLNAHQLWQTVLRALKGVELNEATACENLNVSSRFKR